MNKIEEISTFAKEQKASNWQELQSNVASKHKNERFSSIQYSEKKTQH